VSRARAFVLKRVPPRFHVFLVQRDFKLDLAAFAAALCLLAFLKILDEVREPGSIDLDRRILLALRDPGGDPIGPPWFEDMWRDITALGSGVVLIAVVLAAVGYYLMVRRWRTALTIIVGVTSAWLLSNWLKVLVDRPRPNIVAHFAYVTSRSFPSGHSMMAAVIYPTLGAILARATRHPLQRLYVLGVSILAALLIGFSRIYLGVHYPTDVLAGWCLGFGFSLLWWIVVRVLQRRGSVERTATAAGG
jgi:undecaprenyl-diphosphatase